MIFLESKSKKQVIYSTITILGLVFTILWFTPILWIIVTSFKPTGEILTNPPQWLPSEFTSFHYDRVFLKPIAQWTFNSLYITIISTLFTIILGATAGYAFARLQFFGSTFLFWVVLSSFMMPFEVFLIPLYRMMGALDLVGTRWSIILPSIASPFAVYLFRQFFLGIPRDLEDAAAVDGAGLWRRFIYIILPLSVPACTSVGILAFAENFNQYLWPLLMSSSDTVKTLPVGIAQFAPSTTMGSTEITDYYGMGAAAATLLAIPSMIVFLILQRFFISNTMTSGMKL